MKSVYPPLKLKALMLVVLGCLSAYSMADTICPALDSCEVNPDVNNGNKVIVASGKYRNGIPTVEEFKSLFEDDDIPGDTGVQSFTVFNVYDLPGSTKPPRVEFSPNTEITVDTSYLNNVAYGPFRQDVEHTGVSFHTEKADAQFVIPKNVHFSLQGQPKEFNEGIIGVDLNGGNLNSQADFTITAPNSLAYYISLGVADIHDSVINLSKNADYSSAIRVESMEEDQDTIVNINNMKIQGNGYGNVGIDVANHNLENHSIANVTNTEINFTNPFSAGFFLNNGSAVNIDGSTINSGIGIMLATNQEVAAPHVFNIKNSSLIGQDALLGINDHRTYIEGAEDDDAIGDETVAAQQPLTLTADNSQLAGRIYIDQNPKLAPKVTFNLKNGSSWLINGNSELDELNIHDSSISFSKGGQFKTLTIHGDLSGSNGLFNLNTSLADRQADKIVIEGKVHGEHKISVSDSRKRPKTPNGQVTLVESKGGGDGSFTMVQDYVDAGKYRYFFHQEDDNKWVLSNDKGAASSGGGHHGSDYEISDFANSLISMRQAANQFVYQLQEPLNARLASLKSQSRGNNNLWLDSNYANDHFDSTGTSDGLATAGFKQKSYSLQLGYDHVLPLGDGDKNQTYLGAFVGQGHSSVDFNGNYKDGNLKAITTGIYVGWQNAGGWFADAAYRYSHLKTSASKMDNSTWHANSLNAQLGKDFNLADKWVVTPKLGMTVGRLSGDEYTNSTTFYRSKLGAAVKTSFALNKISLNPYVGAYWMHDKSGLGHAVVDDENLRIAGAGNSGLYEAGLGVDFDHNNHADFKLNYANGQKTEQKFGVNLNYRYSW
ncbi:autotransporter outer membrane beta-barrel domain-containing protein [Snodgrassella alvi]|uniref:autotransporter outer membrane beta-barrel domain-containing protein n=1 Tax=Snodgrassella alvi TaxID=1196083 RepID=UPI000C1F264A|nr:autotransporter outer membrane beta-barrel domain-containing protein [Snodgrassella alvi]PIT16181.1 hypothetical protein BGI33_04840 [Snodgrassella alvi]PIT20873.1 hypothetical protein BGI34_01910 [Snodgrassella alvi]